MRNTHLRFLAALPFVFLFLLKFRPMPQVRFDRVENVAVEIAGAPDAEPWSGGINYPLTSSLDMDGDGRKDLFVFDRFNNRVSCFLNTGSTNVVTAWQYAPEMVQRFPPINKWALFYDYNCDGKGETCSCSRPFFRPASPPGATTTRKAPVCSSPSSIRSCGRLLPASRQHLRQRGFHPGLCGCG